MFDYLQKFNTLPQNLRESVSQPAAMAVILELENKYKIDLAATVMKVMTKIIPLADLSIFFVSDFSLDEDLAKRLTADLKERLFFPVANYLGYNASYSSVLPKSAPAPTPIPAPKTIFSDADSIIKEAGVSFASLDLSARFKNILTTYIKGIRSRVDARMTLNKEVISGGLGLDHKVIDKIFKITDEHRAGQILPSGEILSLPKEEAPKPGLEKIRALYEKPGSTRDIPYDLKSAITSGEIKKPEAPLNLPIPNEASEKLLVEVKKEIKPISVPLNIKPIPIDAIRAVPIPVVNSVVHPVEEIKSIVQPDSDMSKLVKPPVKKPGLFSKLFNGDKDGASLPITLPKIVPPIVIPTVSPSMAAMRSAAAAPQVKPVVKPEVHSQILRQTPKVMGPLDELHYLDIVNFRRFGTSPVEMAAKVESKIKLLEKDGYDKMVSGVAFWRESPVNYLYLKMGQEALTKGLSFKQYAADCQMRDAKNYLSWDEIEAILALNSRLMF